MVVRTHARESPPHAAPERRAPRPCSLAWVCCCRADSFPGVRAAANAGFYPTADTALKRLTELGGEAFDAFKAAERVTSTQDASAKDIFAELTRWEADAKRSDSNLREGGGAAASAVPAVRKFANAGGDKPRRVDAAAEQQDKDKLEQIQGGSNYFDRWDKFAKEEVAKLESDDAKEAAEAEARLCGERRAAAEAAAKADAAGAEALGEAAFTSAAAAAAAMSAAERAFSGDAEKDKGNEEFRAKEYSAAVRCYTLSLIYKPGVAATHANRSAAYLKLKRYDDVVSDCTAALKLEPGYVKALSRRGAALLELGKPREALGDLRAAASAQPSVELSRLVDRAAKEHEAELEKKGLGRKTRIAIAEESDSDEDDESKGEAVSAPARTRLVIEEESDEEDEGDDAATVGGASAAAPMRTELVIEEDSEDEGEVASAAPAESAAERAVRERERGNGLFRAGQLEAALDAYELSIAAEPTASAHANAALVLLRMRRAEEAVTQADAGLGLEPGHVKALHRRACARRMLGQLDMATADYAQLSKVMPSDETIAAEAKALREAVELRDLKANGTSGFMQMRKGPMTFEEVDSDNEKEEVVPPPPKPTPKPVPKPAVAPKAEPKAEPRAGEVAPPAEAAAAKAPSPTSPAPSADQSASLERGVQAKVQQELGNRHFRGKRLKEAVECYTTSIKLSPTAAVHANRALCRLSLGDGNGCVEDCDAALRLDSAYTKAYHRRATARMRLGDIAGAVEDLERVAADLPDNSKVKRELAEAQASAKSAGIAAGGGYDDDEIPRTEIPVTTVESLPGEEVAAASPVEASRPEVPAETSKKSVAAPDAKAEGGETPAALASPAQRQEQAAAAINPEQPSTPSSRVPPGPARTPSPAAAAAAAKAAAAARHAAMTPPKTPTDFERSLSSLRDDTEGMQQYVLSVAAADFQRIFKDNLSGSAISTIMRAHGAACAASGEASAAEAAVEAALALTSVKRFSMAVMLLGKAEKAIVKEAVEAMEVAGADSAKLATVRAKYRIK